ncbi:MAG: hypothetical protein MI748_12320 [Opitutales bacterium]|nr:hypothetical protein [Opitutales bacterium]
MDSELPELILLSDFDGSWESYCDHLYQIFFDSLIRNQQQFNGKRVSVQRRPDHDGKHFGFWHMISKGQDEEERIPDLQRCERISWISWMIRHVDRCDEVRVLRQRRKGKSSYVIWHVNEDYMIVLHDRRGYYLLKTAYTIRPHKRMSLNKEWEDQNSKNG